MCKGFLLCLVYPCEGSKPSQEFGENNPARVQSQAKFFLLLFCQPGLKTTPGGFKPPGVEFFLASLAATQYFDLR
jgi:hypothetical protein